MVPDENVRSQSRPLHGDEPERSPHGGRAVSDRGAASGPIDQSRCGISRRRIGSEGFGCGHGKAFPRLPSRLYRRLRQTGQRAFPEIVHERGFSAPSICGHRGTSRCPLRSGKKSFRVTEILHIAGRRIGTGFRAYVIAELSANHNRNYDQAERIVRAAKDAGADAVKLQTYTPDTITIASDRQEFRVSGGTQWDGRTLHDLYAEAFMPWEWQPRLKQVAEDLGMNCFSSAFDATAVDFLEQMNVPAHKVASFELVDIPLIQKMARTGKPLIISTGMATVEEIDEAVQSARAAGATQIALLKCTSAYPAPVEEMNVRTIPEMGGRFGGPR